MITRLNFLRKLVGTAVAVGTGSALSSNGQNHEQNQPVRRRPDYTVNGGVRKLVNYVLRYCPPNGGDRDSKRNPSISLAGVLIDGNPYTCRLTYLDQPPFFTLENPNFGIGAEDTLLIDLTPRREEGERLRIEDFGLNGRSIDGETYGSIYREINDCTGGFLRSPTEVLLDQLALEEAMRRAGLVGEDINTFRKHGTITHR